jgi:hypothetical protein
VVVVVVIIIIIAVVVVVVGFIEGMQLIKEVPFRTCQML